MIDIHAGCTSHAELVAIRRASSKFNPVELHAPQAAHTPAGAYDVPLSHEGHKVTRRKARQHDRFSSCGMAMRAHCHFAVLAGQ